jgi:hypothetical protein
MAHADTKELIRRLIAGDRTVAASLMKSATTSNEPLVLVLTALTHPAETGLLLRALQNASSTRDRQVIAIASAFLAHESHHVHALARDHLVDHPDSVLVAWLAATTTPHAEARRPIPRQNEDQETS